MKRLFTLLMLLVCTFPLVAEAATEYEIDDVFRKLYPRPEWYIKLTTSDGQWTFCYDILTDEIEPGRVYTLDDMLASDCQAYDNHERVSHKFTSATYCETYNEAGDIFIEATATTADGMDILLHYGIEALPIAIDTVQVVTNDVELQDMTSRGAAVFVGKTENCVLSVGTKGKEIAGEYNWDKLYQSFCYAEPEGIGEPVYMLDGHATIEATERGYKVDGYFLGEDTHCYHAVFTYEVPEPIETRVIRCDNLVVNTTYTAQYGEIIYEASNEDWELELWVNSDKPLGTFSGNIVDAYYSVLTNRHTKEMMDLYYADFTVSTDDKYVILSGGMLARDKNYYILYLTAPLVENNRTVNIDISNGQFFDNTENGVLQFYGTSADNNLFVSLALKTNEIVTSTYDRSQTHRDYTYVEEYKPYHIFYEPYMATINTIVKEDGSIDIEAYLRCDNLVNEEDHPLYVVRMHCTASEAQLGMKFDAQSLDFDEHLDSDKVQIDSNALEDGYVFLDGYDPTTRCTISLVFNINKLDPIISIPAGVYPINNTWQPGTVSSSGGVQDGVVWPSYAAYGDSEGSLDIPVWLLQEGTVTVSNNNGQLYAEVEALNSCKRRVHITIGGTPEGISVVRGTSSDYTTRKMLRHDQLYIKRGTRTFDAQGRISR